MGRPRQKASVPIPPPTPVSSSSATGTTSPHAFDLGFDLDMDLDIDLDLDNLLKEDPFQLHNMALPQGRAYSLPSPVMQPNASEASHSNTEVLGVGNPFDYLSGSEQMTAEFPQFQEFQDDDHGSGAGAASQPDLKDEYRERLANLSSALFRQLNHMDSGQTAETSYFALQPYTSARSDSRGQSEGANNPNASRYPIGQMLRCSQKFLGILKYFLFSSYTRSQAPPHAPSEASNGSDRGAEEQDSRCNDISSSTTSNNSAPPNSRPPNSSPKPTTFSRSSRADLGGSAPNPPPPPGNPPPIDLPTMLAIFTCYVSLVRVYRSILTQIDDSLNSPNPYPFLGLPPILPGLHLDGFGLEHHHSLQINVLIQVSMEFLDRIERAVAALAGTQPRDPAATTTESLNMPSGYASLLEMVVRQEAPRDLDGEQEGGIASLRALVKKINRNLKMNVCMQLNEAEAPS